MADEAPQTPAAVPGVETDGGVIRVQSTGDPAAQEAHEHARNNEEAPKPNRPEGLPEGFDTWEDFGKAQLEKGKEEPKDEAKPEGRAPEVQAQLDALPEAQREKAAPFFDEFAKEGKLSDESVKKAAEVFAVSEDMVRLYIKGAEAESASALDTVLQPIYEGAGGKETYDAFAKWAVEGGLTAEQQAQFDKDLDSGAGAPAKVAKWVADWKAAGHGPAARDIARGGGQEPAQAQVVGFRSRAEQTAAINDPRYAKDPAYRADIEKRIAATTAF